MKSIYSFGLILCLSVSILCGQTYIEKVEAEMERFMLAEQIPAISIALVINGKEVHYLNKGQLSRTTTTQVTEHSLYQIGSLGKMFIGLIIHNLLLEGKLQLEQPIPVFFPELSPGSKKKLANTTIESLLHQRSGFPRNTKAVYKRKDGEPYLYDYQVEDFIKELETLKLKKIGSFIYSNFGYGTLSIIAERAAHTPFPELLARYLTNRYEMKNTQLTLTPSNEQFLVTPYRKDARYTATKPWKMGKMAPPSAVYSNTKDLATLMVQQLAANQAYESSREVTPLILSENTQPLSENAAVSYGYGLFVGQNG
ncbi:MAG: serine hydrolase domain-containing protein, partial [Bacteroidota bacterium]